MIEVDCQGESARLRLRTAAGDRWLFVKHPREVVLKNSVAVSFQFACGPLQPLTVAIEYLAGPDPARGTIGEVTAIEFR